VYVMEGVKVAFPCNEMHLNSGWDNFKFRQEGDMRHVGEKIVKVKYMYTRKKGCSYMS